MARKNFVINSDIVVEFWDWMTKKYGTKIVNKRSSWLMHGIAWFLDFFCITEKEDFLNDYTTTIGRTIYVPFAIGEKDGKGYFSQIITCVHEHKHVEQWSLWYAVKYLLSDKWRARYEAEAYACHIELFYWYYNDIISLTNLTEDFEDYALEADDMAAVINVFNRAACLAVDGIYLNEISRQAIAWLSKRLVCTK